MEENKSSKKPRKYKSNYRKKILDKIKKVKDKNCLVSIFKIVNRDIGNNFSENKSGIYFNLNIVSDDAIEEIVEILKIINENDSISETTEDKLTYKSYSEN